MGFQMIDRDEGQAARGGQGLARHHADQDAADQARPGRGGDGVDAVPAAAGLVERRLHDTADLIQVRAGRDLGHHAGEGQVVSQLLMHHVGQHVAPVAHHGGGGLVTAGFNAQNAHGSLNG